VQQLPGYNLATKDKDRQTARQLMAAAGYPDGEINWQMLPSSPLPTTANYEIAIRVQDQLKKLWPKMNAQVTPPTDSAAFSRQQAEGNFSAISFKNTSLADAALELGSQWHSPGGGLGSRNYGHFKNADMDTLIEKAYVTVDNEARKSLIVDFQKRFAEEWQPAVFLHIPPDRYFVSPKLGGFDQAAGPWWYINYRVAEATDLFWKTS
jgi:ABC-type transport system substrate-binding protein